MQNTMETLWEPREKEMKSWNLKIGQDALKMHSMIHQYKAESNNNLWIKRSKLDPATKKGSANQSKSNFLIFLNRKKTWFDCRFGEHHNETIGKIDKNLELRCIR